MPSYIYGIHPVEDLLSRKGRAVEKLWIQKGPRSKRVEKIVQEARKSSVSLCFEERNRMDKLVQGARHQGVIASCVEKATLSLAEILQVPARMGEDPFFVVLDHVEDPGNLGAVVRTAAAAGVHGLILPTRGTAPLGAVAFKRSAGALDSVPMTRVPNLVRTLNSMKEKGIWVIGASADAPTRYTDADLSGPVALVIGGEKGVRRLVRQSCDLMVSIPMRKELESLNLSVAAGLLMYEVLRIREKSQR